MAIDITHLEKNLLSIKDRLHNLSFLRTEVSTFLKNLSLKGEDYPHLLEARNDITSMMGEIEMAFSFLKELINESKPSEGLEPTTL